MKLLFLGDVVNEDVCGALKKFLPEFAKVEDIHIIAANGENSANGNGVTIKSANMLFSAGVDVITGGNHSLRRDELGDYYSDEYRRHYGNRPLRTLIPANLRSPLNKGYVIIEKKGVKLGFMSLTGNLYMNQCDNPFDIADGIVSEFSETGVKNIFLDFHAEATSEKKAMQFFLSGRVTGIFGTHTHIRTADAQIKRGTAYITDAGMTGVTDSVLGLDETEILPRFKDYAYTKNLYKRGTFYMNGVICEFDETTGKTLKLRGISEKIVF